MTKKKAKLTLEELMTVAEVAKNEDVTTKRVYQWIDDKKIIPVTTMGTGHKKRYLIGKNYTVVRKKG